MAKLRDEILVATNKVGQEYRVTLSVSVLDRTGLFKYSLPTDLIDVAKKNIQSSSSKGLSLEIRGDKFSITAFQKEPIFSFLKRCADDYIECEEIKSIVILYLADSQHSVVSFNDGEFIQPNGYPRSDTDYQYSGVEWDTQTFNTYRFDSTENFPFGFLLAAGIYNKTEYIRASATKTIYSKYHSCQKDSQAVKDLSSYQCTINFKRDLGLIKEVTFTEQNAIFFSQMLNSVAKLSIAFHRYFKDPRILEENIQAKANPFLLLTSIAVSKEIDLTTIRELTVGDTIYPVDDFYREGARAAADGNHFNPYRSGSNRHDHWQYGHDNELDGYHKTNFREKDGE